ncbi:MAG: MFS transporter [Beggiatoa sp.]|nr:MFS transporter [Beggiatoa sp.]
MHALTSKLVTRLPTGGAARVFLVVAFVDAAGRGLFLAGSALFYTQHVGLSVTQVGVAISLAGLTGFICAVPIGRLADRVGDVPILIGLQLWRAAGFLVYPLVSDFGMFLVVACCIGVADVAFVSIIQSLAGSVAKDLSLVQTMAMVAVTRNVAYTLAALAASVVITAAQSSAYVALVLANAVAFLVSAVLLARLWLPRAHVGRRGLELRQVPLKDLPFLALALLNGILYLHLALLSVAFPLWIVTHTAAPKALVGIVLVVNTAMAVLLQVRLSRGADDVTRAGDLQRRAGFALAGFCVLTAVSGTLGALSAAVVLVLAIVALTLAELWQSAGAWGVSYGLSPPEQRTYYLSVYNLGATAMAVLGPGLLAVAVVEQGWIGWIGLGAVFTLAGAAIPLIARTATRRH